MWVAKIDRDGTRIVWATYLGGQESELYSRGPLDTPRAISVDFEGNVYVAGTTETNDFPVVNALIAQPSTGPTDAFVVKLNPRCSAGL